jgi:hypothetical protein
MSTDLSPTWKILHPSMIVKKFFQEKCSILKELDNISIPYEMSQHASLECLYKRKSHDIPPEIVPSNTDIVVSDRKPVA